MAGGAGLTASAALIDKGSVIVALLLAWLLLGEVLTPAKMLGAAIMIGGLVVIARS